MPVCARLATPVRHLLFFVAGLSLCGTGLRHLPPAPRIPQVTEKLEQFRADGPFDVVFLGSSKVFRGVVPEVFDAELRRRGHSVRSFNLGIDGMGFLEAAYLFDQIAPPDRAALRWVLVELAGVRTTLQPAERGTIRELYWHDWRRTWWVGRCILRGEGGAAPWSLVGAHLRLFVRRGLAIGQGAERLPGRLGLTAPAAEKPRLDPTAEGYEPMPFGLTPATVEQYEKSLRQLRSEPPQPGLPASGDALRAFATQVARSGAQVVFFVPPNASATRRHHAAGAPGTPPPLWAFDDPDAYPDLYRLENRADALHLSDPGARAFSLVLADRFSRELGSRQDGPREKGVAP